MFSRLRIKSGRNLILSRTQKKIVFIETTKPHKLLTCITRWEHIFFCCVNHVCVFSMFWKFMGESFSGYTAKNVKTLNCSWWGIVRTPAPGFWSVSQSAHGLVWLWIIESHWHQDINQWNSAAITNATGKLLPFTVFDFLWNMKTLKWWWNFIAM